MKNWGFTLSTASLVLHIFTGTLAPHPWHGGKMPDGIYTQLTWLGDKLNLDIKPFEPICKVGMI